MFELEKEAFGLQFPEPASWNGIADAEKDRQIGQCLEIYARIIERFNWDALMVYWPWSDPEGIHAAKKFFGNRIAIGGVVGGGIISLDTVGDWMSFAVDMVEHRDKLFVEAEQRCKSCLELIDRLSEAGADFIFVAIDVAFNSGPFISPHDFAEICTPYLARILERMRRNKVVSIYHSDGYLMPILDQIIACKPDVLHSIDPMAGMDIAEVKRITYGKVALMGNVQCSFLQKGPKDAIRSSALYCLKHGIPGGGYIFSSSNTIFKGVPLENYEYMLEVFHNYCEFHNRSSIINGSNNS